jgi:arginine repressor
VAGTIAGADTILAITPDNPTANAGQQKLVEPT